MEDLRESYKKSGVDVNAGYKSVELIKKHVKKTEIDGVLGAIGGFGGLFSIDIKKYKNPVLVSGTDGVGTKVKLAFLMDKHDTIGIDCVAMCANDIICSGAKPLFFLDYIACGKNYPQKIEKIVKGISDGCLSSNCALIGGETAEHPGLMDENEYDVAGFCVGVVEKDKILKTDGQKEGDVLIALPSSGVHSNGFSLVRKIFDIDNANLDSDYGVLDKSLGKTLLTPTTIYVKPILKLLEEVNVKSISHITGGGFYENLPRSIKSDLKGVIDKSSLKIPKIFKLIQEKGNLSDNEMFATFNMGVGMCCIVDKNDANKTLEILIKNNIDAYILGELKKGENTVEII